MEFDSIFNSLLSDQQVASLVFRVMRNHFFSYSEAEEIVQEARMKFFLAKEEKRVHPDENESNETHTKIHKYLWLCINSTAIDKKRKKMRQKKTVPFSTVEQKGGMPFDPTDPVSSSNAKQKKQNVYVEETIAREELDRAKEIILPNRAGNDNRYLIWYRVDLYFVLRRCSNKQTLPPEIVIYDDEKKWPFREDWPSLIELCQATYQSFDCIKAKTDVLDKIVNKKLQLAVSHTTWNKWIQRMRDDIREKLFKEEFPFLWKLFKIQEK